MSIQDAERFANDLKTNKDLMAQVKPMATGLASIVAIGKKHGYNFTVDEAKQYIRQRSPRPMSDAQMERVAGGATAVQTAAVATTAVEAAEVATTAVQVAEAAADVAAAAEAVVVVAAVLI